ncbi:DUF3088 domain-containing protein [Bradyrhizobium sp. ma5]|uniref:DUF3088 domain-containing protein n=1 Tax=Bradyrhizobium sp. ma5 TaxID=3344828 RepID=UPI0035D405B7
MSKRHLRSTDKSQKQSMPRDQLFLLQQPFEDPAFPGQEFYCWHCALIEGVLSSFPSWGANLDVRRLAWARPRAELIERLDVDHQSLPVLILGKASSAPQAARFLKGLAYVDDALTILQLLVSLHGFPAPHP